MVKKNKIVKKLRKFNESRQSVNEANGGPETGIIIYLYTDTNSYGEYTGEPRWISEAEWSDMDQKLYKDQRQAIESGADLAETLHELMMERYDENEFPYQPQISLVRLTPLTTMDVSHLIK